MKEINPIEFKEELMRITNLSEKHINNFINHLVYRLDEHDVEFGDLVFLYNNETINGTNKDFALKFIGYFHLSTFLTFLDLALNECFK